MKLFFWRKGDEKETNLGKRESERLPLLESWESRILSRNPHISRKAIIEAGEKRDPAALPALIALAKQRGPLAEEAVEVIPLIILLNPGNPEIIAMLPEIEKGLDAARPTDEVWLVSAITYANPGLFSCLAPILIEMLDNFSKRAETDALKDVVLSLGNIGHKSAIAPLEKLLESGCGDDELRKMIADSLETLRSKTVYVQ